MSQIRLSAFSEEAEPKAAPANNCWTCHRKQDIIMQANRQMVKCQGRGIQDFREGCPSWTDDKELEHMAAFAPPEGFIPRKWREV